jgi:hypothetical protein
VVSTAVSLLGLAAAIAMPNNLLRGREHGANNSKDRPAAAPTEMHSHEELPRLRS